MTRHKGTSPGVSGRIGAGLLRLPDNQRDLFELLATHESGLEDWLRRIDLDRATPAHIYHMAHRRPPDSIAASLAPPGHDPRAQLGAALMSAEFRNNAVLNLLHAFPELRRCAVLAVPGVPIQGLLAALATVQAVLPHQLGLDDDAPPEAFLAALSSLVRGIAHGGDVVAECVDGLERYQARVGHRPSDRIVVVIDDPVQVMVGQACAAVALLRQDPQAVLPRSRDVARALGVPAIAPGASSAELRRLAEQALAHPSLCRPDAICRTLSHTPGRQFRDALNAAVIFDIEFTTRADLPAWLLERWGVVARPVPAADDAILSAEEAIAALPDILLDATEDDRLLYNLVAWGLEQTGRPGITGQELARLAGPDMLRDRAAASPASPGPGRFPPRRARPALPDPVIARGPFPVSAPLSGGMQGGMQVAFGADGTSQDHIGTGWSVVEAEARWTDGAAAELVLPRPAGPGPHRLRIDATPFLAGARLPVQRVGVLINGHAAALAELAERSLLDIPIADRLLALDRQLRVTLTLPDAASPRALDGGDDDRRLALYVRAVSVLASAEPAPSAELPLAELAIRFESIGENCEFGLVQRRWGAEPLGLLRFASAPPDKLLPALRRGFAGMGAPGQLEVELHGGREYMVLDRRYGFLYHAWAQLGELTPAEILAREHRRVPLLVRKLTEDLAEGEKLFVYHAMRPLAQHEAQELADAVASFGRGVVLWLELADADHPPGTVVRINERLLKGHMDRFAPGENAHDISVEGWVAVCRNALRVAGR